MKKAPLRIANQQFLARGSFSSRSVLTQYRTLSEPKTLSKKTVHTYELRGCSDLFIWFGGPPTIVSRAISSAVPSLSLPLDCYWLLQRSICLIFFSTLWVLGKFRFIEMSSSKSSAQSSCVLSLCRSALQPFPNFFTSRNFCREKAKPITNTY